MMLEIKKAMDFERAKAPLKSKKTLHFSLKWAIDTHLLNAFCM
jgi:hypothetical protein